MAQLSIVVTSYNIEGYIEQCLDSIVEQTLHDIEIIVVDDGSSDGTPAIIERFAERDDRIVPVLLGTNSPGGVATAANAGLARATAPYIGFADGDDFYEPTMFEKLLDAARRNDSDLAMCKYQLFHDESELMSEPAEVSRWTDLDESVLELDVDNQKRILRFIAVPWRKIYRRSMLEENKIRFPVGDYFYEDNPFHWFSVLSAKSIAIVPEVLCYHRVARAGQTMDTADERLFRIFQHHATIRAWISARGLADEFNATLLAWAISQMEWIAPRTPKELRRQLFDVLRGVFGPYNVSDVEQALVEGNKGQTARLLSTAVRTGNFANFNRALDTRAKASNPVVAAAYHLRYSGFKHTARLTRRFAANKLTESNGLLMGRLRPRSDLSNSDLMFALIVLEQRLDAIEARLSDSE